MIDNAFLRDIGLNENQVTLLREGLDHESRYRQILLQEGVNPKVTETIIRNTRHGEVDLTNEALLREKVRAEWADFIKKK